MGRIAILIDLEEGHLFPTFALAHQLMARGHEVIYLTIMENIPHLKAEGLKYEIIFSDIYGNGTRQKHQDLLLSGSDKRFLPHLLPLINGVMDTVLNKLKPDLLLTSYFLSLESLIIHHRYQLAQVFLNPSLRKAEDSPRAECVQSFMSLQGEIAATTLDFILQRAHPRPSNLEDLAAPLEKFTELILCPDALEIPERKLRGERIHYVGPSVRKTTPCDFPELKEQGDKKIIYLSFGSQVSLYKKSYRELIDIIVEIAFLPIAVDWCFFISTGPDMYTSANLPVNVIVKKWMPQLQILDKASVAIIHGGLGTVKECISREVPMLVFPMLRDQPDNAERIEYHQLGILKKLEGITRESIVEGIVHLLGSEEIRNSLKKIRGMFDQAEQDAYGIKAIENLMMQALAH